MLFVGAEFASVFDVVARAGVRRRPPDVGVERVRLRASMWTADELAPVAAAAGDAPSVPSAASALRSFSASPIGRSMRSWICLRTLSIKMLPRRRGRRRIVQSCCSGAERTTLCT